MEDLLNQADWLKWVVTVYFIVGTIFVAYSLAIFVLKTVTGLFKFSLCSLFLALAFFFFNLGGKLLSNHDGYFSLFVIINSVALAICGLICVWLIFKKKVF